MYKNVVILTFCSVLLLQVCKADEVDDADAALEKFKTAVGNNLSFIYSEYTKWSAKIDATAIEVKANTKTAIREAIEAAACDGSSAKEITGETDPTGCIHMVADGIIDTITNSGLTLADQHLRKVATEEKKKIRCDRTDVDCLQVLTTSIKKLTADFVKVIERQIEINKKDVDKKLAMIEACGNSFVHKAKELIALC